MPTSLAFQAASAARFIQEFWPQAKELAAGSIDPDIHQFIICGCGDSHHASYALSYAIGEWTEYTAQGIHAMEAARYAIPRAVGEGLLVVGISASGETARTIEALRMAKDLGAQTLGITAAPGSTFADVANVILALNLPEQPEGPGLISYLGALLAGYAIGAQAAESGLQRQIDDFLLGLPHVLSDWVEAESQTGHDAAQRVDPSRPIIFLGSGPVRGAAMFAGAKVVEAAGQSASSQDIEEWAHLEYFIDPPQLPVWLLSAGGRTLAREREIEKAAIQIGRTFMRSEWEVGPDAVREVLSPLALWAGPVAYADSLMARIGEVPFRNFSGGRDRKEGGGISRIRSSVQLHSVKDLSNTNPPN